MRSRRTVPAQATESAYGGLATDAAACRPLDIVTVRIKGRTRRDTRCTIRVCDPGQRPYVEADVRLRAGRGTFRFAAGGLLGTHYVYLFWPGEEPRRAADQ